MSRRSRIAVVALALSLLISVTHAGRGVGELALDRGAVHALLEAGLPEPTTVRVPGVGPVEVRLTAPTRLVFEEDAIEATLGVVIAKLGFETTLAARFVPELERATGTWQLRPETVELELPPPLRLDVADWLVPVPLPRRLDWQLELGADRPLDVTCFIQSVTVDENRLRIDLGLVAR